MNAAPSSASTIDFKKYRTPELVSSMMDIIDWRNKLVSIFKIAFWALLILLIVSIVLTWTRASDVMFAAVVGYSFISGTIAALAFAIAWTGQTSLQSMDQVVDLTFKLSQQVADDIRGARAGEIKMPTSRKLVEGVYTNVILATLEETASKSFGFLGRPLLFAYKLSLGRMIRKAISYLPDGAFLEADEEMEERATKIAKSLAGVGELHDKNPNVIASVQKGFQYVGAKAKFLIMLPCYIVCSIAFLIYAIPVLVVILLIG